MIYSVRMFYGKHGIELVYLENKIWYIMQIVS